MIELFSAVVNPEKLGKVISTFIDLKVAPLAMNSLSQELADCPEVVNLLQDLQQRLGLSYLFIAHDLAVIKHIASRVAVMYLGRIVELGDTPQIFSAPRHPYTQALMQAIPLPEPGLRRQRALLSGDVPSPIDPPSGCHLHTRCTHAQAICSQIAPALEGDAAHAVACHFPLAKPPAAVMMARAVEPARLRLQRLQSAFSVPAPEAP